MTSMTVGFIALTYSPELGPTGMRDWPAEEGAGHTKNYDSVFAAFCFEWVLTGSSSK